MPDVGSLAPTFTLPDMRGNQVSLEQFRGQKVVLYFYPKDDTPGCTKEACSFRDAHGAYQEKGIVVLGVSLDDEASHRAFAEKYQLPFTLLADTSHTVSEAYGVYGEQEWQGKKFMGLARKTFLIDEQGVIVKIFDKVNVEAHSQEVLEAFGLAG
ncbi:thioredoxin-dependent thiol peroxidase [Chloracidobacterium validum]|uniref:thioredoxin-dependent peroxiredoxin n=1 Tax=Chloracidobacterium validum TaxID=2821543 RepID=A0ABX8B4J6_9BACT|nr:thioredoxin-dependent thiol peroxidase [Chloracidobacterium validum]QUW01902.1 thioredoxin-dependent thiol peroxidase [Chloracidobacterium validum]